jgi:hypothetical protein
MLPSAVGHFPPFGSGRDDVAVIIIFVSRLQLLVELVSDQQIVALSVVEHRRGVGDFLAAIGS